MKQLNLFSNHAQRHRIYAKLQADIKAGRESRQPCFVTGELDVEAHHYNYRNPEAKVWLSIPIHLELHKKIKELQESGVNVTPELQQSILNKWKANHLCLSKN
jgi:hypothetical protein